MNLIKKLALLFCITAALFLTSCKVSKNISKQETSQESEAKVDSTAVEKKDIEKVSKVKTVITERADTAVTEPGFTAVVKKDTVLQDGTRVEFKGTAVKITKPTRKIPVKINKTTTVTADIRETDQSKVKVEVKKKEEKKEETSEKGKVIEKTGMLPGWAWRLIALLILIALAWRFRKFLK